MAEDQALQEPWWLDAMMETCRLAVGKMPGDGQLGYSHIAGMAIQAKEPGFENDKGLVWLGWMQCAVEAAGVASTDAMRAINKAAKVRAGRPAPFTGGDTASAPDSTPGPTEAWAVVEADGSLDPRNASNTRRSAIINWLVTARGMMVVNGDSDELIERMWSARKGGASAVKVSIAPIATSPARQAAGQMK